MKPSTSQAGGLHSEADGGTRRGRRCSVFLLTEAQQSLLLQLFKRHNSSKHRIDIITQGMRIGGPTGHGPQDGSISPPGIPYITNDDVCKLLWKQKLRFNKLTEAQASMYGGLGSG